MTMKYNTIIIYAQLAQEAEQILKRAERVLRWNWNLYGFKRIDSGYQYVVTDGFGNPYGDERVLKLFGIAIEVPEYMDHLTAMTYLRCGTNVVNCYAEYHYTNT